MANIAPSISPLDIERAPEGGEIGPIQSGWRLGLEWYYTGRQRLEENPYRDESAPYHVFGVLASYRLGRTLFFINGENLTDVRQTDWNPLLRPARGIDGRWTVDAWAPLDGRNINAGVRIVF